MDTFLAQIGYVEQEIWAIAFAVVVSVTLLCVALYPNRSIGVPPRDDIPGPRGLPLVGNLLQVLSNRRRMIPFMKELGEQYGPLYTLTLPGWGRMVFVNHPEWLAHIKKREYLSI